MDRRRSNRYDLTSPVGFSWKNADGLWCWQEGRARDISESGVFVVTDQPPPTGSAIRFELSFVHPASAQRVQIQASGSIVRIDKTDGEPGEIGFAATTMNLRLFDREPNDTSCGSVLLQNERIEQED
jgi:PilZ domain